MNRYPGFEDEDGNQVHTGTAEQGTETDMVKLVTLKDGDRPGDPGKQLFTQLGGDVFVLSLLFSQSCKGCHVSVVSRVWG